MENLALCVLSSFITIFLTTLLSIFLYENVILKESANISNNFERVIKENHNLLKRYQFKINRGFKIIKTIIHLTYSTFNNKSKNKQFPKPQNLLTNWNHNKKLFQRAKINNTNKNNLKNENQLILIKKRSQAAYKNKYILDKAHFINLSQNNNYAEKNPNNISSSRNLLINKKLEQNNIKILKNKQKRFETLKIREEKYECNKFILVRTSNYHYLSIKKSTLKAGKVKNYFCSGERKFTFPGKYNDISCSKLSITKNSVITLPKNTIKVYIKIIFILLIYIIISFYLMFFIQNISEKYGNSFIEVCILPFFINLAVKYIFTFNFMMLITSLILYNFGDYFLNNKKVPLYLLIVSKIFISPSVLNHYSAIKLYKYLK